MDRKVILIVGIVLVFLIFSYPVLAAIASPVVIERDGQGRPTVIVEPGEGKDAGLVRVTQIHYIKQSGDRPQPPAKKDACYKLAQWRWTDETLPIGYTIDEILPDLDDTVEAITNAILEWDNNTLEGLFDTPVTGPAEWNPSADGMNSIVFQEYGSSSVIAVTRTWYGRFNKTAVESDILFNTLYEWSDGKDPITSPVMDIQNIATHEIGHTLGLSDIYSRPCNLVTMYGYSGYNETIKQTLEPSDIAGLQQIYELQERVRIT